MYFLVAVLMAKEIFGLPLKVANNRKDINNRAYPCPTECQDDIKKAFQYFGMINIRKVSK